MELINPFLNPPDVSFFLFGPRGTGKSTFITQCFQNCGCCSIPLLSKRNYMGYEVKKTEHSGAKKG
jgi:predicted kinase